MLRAPCSMLFIVGPTAVGKSAVAIELAERLNGEIVSCDAMQVYREPNIISDRPSSEMLRRAAHHVTAIVSVEEDFSAARFRELAGAAIADILKRGKLPIVCGGSGMYMMALLDGLLAGGEPDRAVRDRLEMRLACDGLPSLYQRLNEVDPEAAQKIKPNDRQRILRALEVFEVTGRTISSLQKERQGLWGQMPIRIFALNRPRAELYRRVEARIDMMIESGLVEEVQALLKLKLTPTAARMVGVPEVRGVLSGEHDLERAKYLMKLNTRHYVKRQLTWFRKDERIEWIILDNNEGAHDACERVIQQIK